MLLPFPPVAEFPASPRSRGQAILQFVISTRVTATCTDLDLLLARHASLGIVADWQGDPNALETVQDARRLIADAIARRERNAAAPVVETPIPAPPAPLQGDGGHRVVAVRVPQPVLPSGGCEIEF